MSKKGNTIVARYLDIDSLLALIKGYSMQPGRIYLSIFDDPDKETEEVTNDSAS